MAKSSRGRTKTRPTSPDNEIRQSLRLSTDLQHSDTDRRGSCYTNFSHSGPSDSKRRRSSRWNNDPRGRKKGGSYWTSPSSSALPPHSGEQRPNVQEGNLSRRRQTDSSRQDGRGIEKENPIGIPPSATQAKNTDIEGTQSPGKKEQKLMHF